MGESLPSVSSPIKSHFVRFSLKNLVTEPQHAHKMAPPEWPNQGAVEFRNVVMRYRPDMEPVLRNVSFEILPQEKVGVIGRTGAGKCTNLI